MFHARLVPPPPKNDTSPCWMCVDTASMLCGVIDTTLRQNSDGSACGRMERERCARRCWVFVTVTVAVRRHQADGPSSSAAQRCGGTGGREAEVPTASSGGRTPFENMEAERSSSPPPDHRMSSARELLCRFPFQAGVIRVLSMTRAA